MRDPSEGDAEVVELCDAVDHVLYANDRVGRQYGHTKTATHGTNMARAADCGSLDGRHSTSVDFCGNTVCFKEDNSDRFPGELGCSLHSQTSVYRSRAGFRLRPWGHYCTNHVDTSAQFLAQGNRAGKFSGCLRPDTDCLAKESKTMVADRCSPESRWISGRLWP